LGNWLYPQLGCWHLGGQKVEDLLFGFNKQKGMTLIIVTHDEDLAQKCDVRIYVKDGKIATIEQKSSRSTRRKVGA
jgi:ABC-type lipoprotein export system ATPase subunit